MIQFIRGFRAMHFLGPSVTVFGSARFQEGHKYYELAVQVGKTFAEMGFAVMTGGGPGIMEAANRGAMEANGISVGCTIKLPKEQASNKYMTKSVHFEHFFIRKVLLLKYSYAFIVLPGGFGTLDELFETLTLIQTKILHDFPVVVMGTSYFSDVRKQMELMVNEGTINAEELKLLLFTDDVQEAAEHVKIYIHKKYKSKVDPSWVLGEE
ncbi:MAG: TIGR00730 family Rossman fold protein [Saprospiraceae bacterium]|nr:TIGR00730 family Rossman fold protein [Saprospiraceae bacterium]